MQQTSKQRIVYLDLLRILATLAVICQHVCASGGFYDFSFAWNWYIPAVLDSLTRYCVPLFVMISGALFLNPGRDVSHNEVLKVRIPRLLVAYLFWSVFYVFYGYVVTGFADFSIQHLFRGLLSSHFHLWFLPMLMGVYLLIPILRKIAQDKKLMQYSLVIWIAFVCISFFRFVTTFKTAAFFHSLFVMNIVAGYSGYFLLGHYLSQQSFSRKQVYIAYLLGILGAMITIAGTFYMSIKKGIGNERYFDSFSFQVIAMSVALFLLAKQLAPKCGKVVLRFVEWVRKDLFGIYLIHVLWIDIINTESFRHCCSEMITLPLITVIVFILSLFTTKLIRLIPVLRKVVD